MEVHHPSKVPLAQTMVARDQQQSKTSGVLVHAAWCLVLSKTLAMATPHRLPNGFRWWDLALAQLTCRSAGN